LLGLIFATIIAVPAPAQDYVNSFRESANDQFKPSRDIEIS
jgi:hypothetical protein